MVNAVKPFVLNDDASLQLVLNTALDAVIVLHADGTVRDWNSTAETVFGWRRAEVLGRPMAERIIPERFRDKHYRGLARYFQTGEGPLLCKRVETAALRKDGQEFPIVLSISPFTYNGETFFLGFVRDVSDRRT